MQTSLAWYSAVQPAQLKLRTRFQGKTAQIIALILSTSADSPSPLLPEPSKGACKTQGTLVVSPKHLCQQWANEIRKFTQKLDVLVIGGEKGAFSALSPHVHSALANATAAHKKTSWARITTSDVVVVSLGYLCSPEYAKRKVQLMATAARLFHRCFIAFRAGSAQSQRRGEGQGSPETR